MLDEAVAVITAGPGKPPGVCLAVSHAGGVAVGSAGVAQAFSDDGPLTAPMPIGIDTATDIGSVTKIVATAAALMQLVRDGQLALDYRLDSILPWSVGSPAGPAKLSQLLQHRAGLWEWWPFYLETRDPSAVLRLAAAHPLRYGRGEARHYSDLGFMLLGAVVAAVRDCDLDRAVRELVLDPLGLTATAYGGPVTAAAPGLASADLAIGLLEPRTEVVNPTVAASSSGDWIEGRMIDTGVPYPVRADSGSFTGWREHVLVGEINDGNAFHGLGLCSGHAGLFSTARDLLRFGDHLLACLRGDHGAAYAAVCMRFLTSGPDQTQGLGFRRWELASGSAWGHTGFPGVALAILPELEATAVMVTNRLHVHCEPRPTEQMWMTALAGVELHCQARRDALDPAAKGKREAER